MQKTKAILFFAMFALILLIFSNTGYCADPITATTTEGGNTFNWSYQLNDNNEIINLKCTNVSDISGNITIPSTIDGKNVVDLGDEAFKNCTEITGVTIPNSVKTLEYKAFAGCTNLKTVNLENVENIANQVFSNCTSLESITIPKTLNNMTATFPEDVFGGCTSLRNITLEDGLTKVPDVLCAKTPIEEITIPTSVKTLGYKAFAGCTNLKTVNLGNVENIANQVFSNCTSLESITIPKTLNNMTATFPEDVFGGCTSLRNITLEDGLTKVPDVLCAKTPIEEITIPNSVNKICYKAFANCNQLKKITILDNVKTMNLSDSSDTIFQNHNEDLTIYCYEDSTAHKYALKYNIKYVLLPRPANNSTDEGTTNNEQNVNETDNSVKDETSKNKDTTVKKGPIDYGGMDITIIGIIALVIIGGVIAFVKYRKLKGI